MNHKTVKKDDYMTTTEAAKVLSVAVRTVQLWVESGSLEAWRTNGGHRRISRESVMAIVGKSMQLKATLPVAEKPTESLQRPLRILLVEDDVRQRQLFALMLEEWTFPVQLVTANNGFEGLLRIGQCEPDMVITDLDMPGMNGLQMLDALLRPNSGCAHLLCIVVTALSRADIQMQGGLPEQIPIFQKPIPFGAIEALARSLLPSRNR